MHFIMKRTVSSYYLFFPTDSVLFNFPSKYYRAQTEHKSVYETVI